jgi:glutamine amidotransferase
MGWNRITLKKQHPVLKDVSQEDEFYFVHSYFPAPEDRESIIGTTDYGIDFASILGKENLIALQFHPEKSGPPGLAILKNFCCWN